ncbi:MAG: CPBP family intramembrane metalloprotease [Ardenticatenaceae bacterium]|nr:CPBP family intramembrane metalloprotease [Ardenticatenaceae bacterium]MCB9443583.1 CPBP family intramembrane metalloprotease [Ardenticatenaceae bacterium]
MPLILGLLAALGIILLANYLVLIDIDRYKRLFDGLLLVLNIPVLLFGGFLVLAPPQTLADLQPDMALAFPNQAAYGAMLAAIALWDMLVCLRPLRQIMARWLPLDSTSPVHTLALMLSGILAGTTLLTLTQGGLEGVAETAVSTPLIDFVFQQALFILLALLGVGLLVRRRLPELAKRLGLERPSWSQIRFGLRWIAILVFIQWAAGIIWALASPDQSQLVEGINNVLLGNFDTVGEWFIVALGAGLGEEILFRGAMQPIFGLWFTSIIFAIAHIQYGFTLVTILIFVISAVLGYIRRRTNTTVAIFVHAGYDFVLGMFFLLATLLEKFIS